MKKIFDLSALDGVLGNIREGKKIEGMISDQVNKLGEQGYISAANRCAMFQIPLSGNRYDSYAFSGIECIIDFRVKKIYSKKTGRAIKEEYGVESYKFRYFHRTNVFEDYEVEVIENKIMPHSVYIEEEER